MNFQKLFNIVKMDYESQICPRAPIFVGSICNCKCEFCYYKNDLTKIRNLNLIKNDIQDLYSEGFREIELTGGEPTTHPDFLKILNYITSLNCYASCLSNGIKFSNLDFIKKAQNNGLKEILFSLHGCCEAQHDKITGRKGSFKKIIQAIKNAQKLGILVRINCTVYDVNFKTLSSSYADLIKSIKPFEVNFIQLNYHRDNKEFRSVNLKEEIDAVKGCILKIEPFVKYINVRYVPFCYMQGFEKYCVDYFQHIYDLYDWDIVSRDKSRKLSRKLYTKKDWVDFAATKCKQDRLEFKKLPGCLDCKFSNICDGIKTKLDAEIFPVKGKKILDVLEFRKGFYDVEEKMKICQKSRIFK